MNCLHPKCKKPVIARGLCWAHYQQARRLVLTGTVNWTTLEQAGKAKARGKRGRPAKASWFAQDIGLAAALNSDPQDL